jgi:pre-mRNA-processing factor 19
VAAELEAKKRQAAAEAAAAAESAVPAKRAKTEGLPEAVVEELAAVSTDLSKGRKKRQVPAGTASVEQLEGYSLQGSYPLHKTTAGGILSIDLLPGQVGRGGGKGGGGGGVRAHVHCTALHCTAVAALRCTQVHSPAFQVSSRVLAMARELLGCASC